jgi:hypothetical protein
MLKLCKMHRQVKIDRSARDRSARNIALRTGLNFLHGRPDASRHLYGLSSFAQHDAKLCIQHQELFRAALASARAALVHKSLPIFSSLAQSERI